VSGSGVATTVTLASLAWPMLKRSGYNPATAGGLTAAAGIGATLSPPTLGAAAFIIAEYLDISYLDVLVMATIPTVLYYLACWLMVEADARRLKVKPVKTSDQSLWSLTVSQGYHFISLAAIAVLLIYGLSAFLAVFWSIVIAVILSMIRPEQRLLTWPGAAAGLAVALGASLMGERLSVAAFFGLIAGGLVSVALYFWEKRQGHAPDEATERLVAALIRGRKGRRRSAAHLV